MKVKDQFHFPASNLICRYGPLCNNEIFNRRISEDGKRWCAYKWYSLQNGSNLLHRYAYQIKISSKIFLIRSLNFLDYEDFGLYDFLV